MQQKFWMWKCGELFSGLWYRHTGPNPFILLFIRQILEWMKNTRLVRLATRLEEKAERKIASIEKYKTLGLMIFCAIPLPGTGAWTGALVAAVIPDAV